MMSPYSSVINDNIRFCETFETLKVVFARKNTGQDHLMIIFYEFIQNNLFYYWVEGSKGNNQF